MQQVNGVFATKIISANVIHHKNRKQLLLNLMCFLS